MIQFRKQPAKKFHCSNGLKCFKASFTVIFMEINFVIFLKGDLSVIERELCF